MSQCRYYAIFLFVLFGVFFSPSHVFCQSDSLTFIGHATMKIKLVDGTIIYIDPHGGTTADYTDSVDIVLITHGHQDHNQQSYLRKKASTTTINHTLSNVGGEYKSFIVGNVKIDAVPAYNGYHTKTICVGYVIEFNGIRIYHTGDTGLINEMTALAARKITYAFFPVDNIFTMSPEQATQAAGRVQATYSIPMHTMPPPDTYDTSMVNRFTPPNKLVIKHGETIALVATPTSAESFLSTPAKFGLEQNFPNPFNPSTTITFTLAEQSYASLKIFDLLGREVSTVVSDILSLGTHTYQWSAHGIPSGTYFYRLRSASFSETKRLILLK